MRLILIRHGETPWNEAGRVQGSSDIELSEKGRQQARRLGQALAGEHLADIYSSPLKRALHTAQEIDRFHGLGVKVEPDLRELNVGELEGLSFLEMRERYGEFLKLWRGGGDSLRLPGGESLGELQERAWGLVQGIVRAHPGGRVVVATHSFTLSAILCRALGAGLNNLGRFQPREAAINILDFGEQGASLVLFNDTCHLSE